MVLNLKNILGAAGTAALIRGPTVSTACPPINKLPVFQHGKHGHGVGHWGLANNMGMTTDVLLVGLLTFRLVTLSWK